MADDSLSIYDEIEIEDMTFDPAMQIYTFPCPCGDRFEIAIDDLRDGEEIAVCPSCSLMIRVIFDQVRLQILKMGLRAWLDFFSSPSRLLFCMLTRALIQADLPQADDQQNSAVAVQA